MATDSVDRIAHDFLIWLEACERSWARSRDFLARTPGVKASELHAAVAQLRRIGLISTLGFPGDRFAWTTIEPAGVECAKSYDGNVQLYFRCKQVAMGQLESMADGSADTYDIVSGASTSRSGVVKDLAALRRTGKAAQELADLLGATAEAAELREQGKRVEFVSGNPTTQGDQAASAGTSLRSHLLSITAPSVSTIIDFLVQELRGALD